MPEIEIRPAISTDIPLLARLDHDVQTDYVWQMNRMVNESDVTIQFREIRLPRSVRVEPPYLPTQSLEAWENQNGLLVGLLQGEPVGYIALDENKAPSTAWVSGLVVAKSVRRQGIATGLILAGQRWAAQRRLRSVLLEVQSKNYPGIRMAFKLGFDFSGYNDHYYASQDIALFFTRFLK